MQNPPPDPEPSSAAVPGEDELRARLSAEQFRVARRKGTERAFSGKYHDCKTPGQYRCVCCAAALFSSDAKFDSGTGWPSFSRPASPQAVREESDNSHFMRRTEVLCARCDAHLGHVFNDGPNPTGLRYCINSASLDLAPARPAETESGKTKNENPA